MTIVLEAARTTTGEDSYYLVKDPDGKVKRHTRASNYTKVLDDDYLLRRNDDRMLAHGVGKRKDLAQLARSHDPRTDRDVYDQTIIPSARAAAETDARANHGTSFHKDTELLDQGAQPVALDPDLAHHYRAYIDTITRLPFAIIHEHTEQVIILDGYQIAGTIDRVVEVLEETTITFKTGHTVHLLPGDRIILDIKSGRWGLEYSALAWQMQCAIYAHHTATWHPNPAAPKDPERGQRGPAVDGLRREVALVFHLNIDDPDATPDLHWLDLEHGYDAFLCAVQVKEHRRLAKRGTCLYTDHLPTAVEVQMEAWVRARLAIVGEHQHAKACLLRQWPLRNPDDSLIKYGDQPTAEQTAALLALLGRIEAEFGLPFCPQPGSQQPTPATKE